MPNDDLINVTPLDTTETVLEVIVLWGRESVLHVAHLPPPHAFAVGECEADADAAPTHFLIGLPQHEHKQKHHHKPHRVREAPAASVTPNSHES